MTIHYLDASAWVKRYLGETGSGRVAQLFEQEATMACSTFGLIETLAALGRAQTARTLGEKAYQRATRDATNDFGRFVAIDFTPEVFSRARSLVDRYALRAGDLLHLASAMVLRDALPAAEKVCVVTSDAELREAARLARFDVLDPTGN